MGLTIIKSLMRKISPELQEVIKISSDIKLPEDVRVERIYDKGYTKEFAKYLVTGIKPF